MIVAVTGHRPDKLGGYKQPNPISNEVKHALSLALDDLSLEAATPIAGHSGLHMIIGMALGVDQWMAELCVKKGIPFTAAIPHTNQEAKWPPYAQAVYHSLLKKAHQAYVISPGSYDSWKMHKRNEYMVDACHLLLAAWDGSPGGTGSCVTYAKNIGRKIRYIKIPTTGWADPVSFEENPPAASWDPKTGLKLNVSPFIHSIKTKAEDKAAQQLVLMKVEEKKFADKLKAEDAKKKTALDVLKPLLVMPSPFPKTPTGNKLSKEQQSLAEEIFKKMMGAAAEKPKLFGPPYTDSKTYTEQEVQVKIAEVFENFLSAPKTASPFASAPWKKNKEKEEKKEEPITYGRKLDLDD